MVTNAPTVERSAVARATLVVSCAATLLVLINFTAPVSTVGTIGEKLGSSASGQTWILGSISVGLAAFLMVAGSLADDYGRKRIFVIGGAIFVLASVACALAPNTLAFVLGRIIQGGASAAFLTSSLGLLGHVFAPGPERTRATGLWGAMIGGGIAIGPVFSALLIKVADWQLAYWLIALMAALVTLWGSFSLMESRSEQRRRLDLVGVVTLGGGLSFLVAALTEGRDGWTQPQVPLFLVTALALIAGFVWTEKRVAEPMLDLGLLRHPAFIAATIGALATGAAVIGFMTYIPIAAQRVLGLSPLQSAGILGIWSGLSLVVAPQARRLIGLIGDRQQIVAGLALCGVGEITLVWVSENRPWWQFVPGLALAGLGSGVVNASLAGMAVRSVPAHRVAMGSGANNTSRYVGSSVGVALVGAVLALAPHGGGAAHEFGVGMGYGALAAGILAIVGAILVALCRERTEQDNAAVVTQEEPRLENPSPAGGYPDERVADA